MSHFWAVIIMLLGCTVLPYSAKKFLSKRQQVTLGTLLGLLLVVNFIAWYILILAAGSFDYKKDLPLQICHFANIFLLVVMRNRNEYWFRIFYFWVLAGTLQAVITPEIQADFPHYWFWRYWILHAGPVVCIVYAAYVYRLRPVSNSIIRSFLAFNIVLMVNGLINYFLNTNYAYLCNKPVVKSLFDYLGPWPWYILTAEVAAFILFTLVYAPYWIMDFGMKRSSMNNQLGKPVK
jgi:hypothetical integral membrane protein (TIGR02206 family)